MRSTLTSVRALCAGALALTGVSAAAQTFQYDPLGRLQQVVGDNGQVVTYDLDAADNIHKRDVAQPSAGSGSPVANSPPVANSDAVDTNQNAATTVRPLLNDRDPNNDALTITSVTTPVHGTAVVQSGSSVLYTPPTGYSGPDSFSYTVQDTAGATASTTVTVDVKAAGSAANNPPQPKPDPWGTKVNTAVYIWPLGNDWDPDDDPMAITAITQGAHGTAAIVENNRGVLYTPASGFVGTDALTYTVSDGRGGTATQQITIDVVSDNAAPQPKDDTTPTTTQNTPFYIFVLGNDWDPDGDTLTIQTLGGPVNGKVELQPNRRDILYTPDPSFVGTDSFSYTETDGRGGVATATVTVTVQPSATNSAPQTKPDDITLTTGELAYIFPLGNDWDPEGDTFKITSLGAAAHGTTAISADGHYLSYTPTAGYSGSDTFSYGVTDARGATSTGQINISISGSNTAPLGREDAATVEQNGYIDIYPLGNDWDAEGDPLVISATSTPAHGTLWLWNDNHAVRYTPTAGYVGSDVFTYTVSDGRGGTATQNINITVTGSNSAPLPKDDAASTSQDTEVQIYPLGNDWDPDGDAMVIASTSTPAHGSVSLWNANKAITYVPAAGFTGTDTFTYTVSDGRGGTATANITVTVGTANNPPLMRDDDVSSAVDEVLQIYPLGNDWDQDGDPLVITGLSTPAHGTVSLWNANRAITYTPPSGFSGTDSFTYSVSDGRGGTGTATVRVTVGP